MSEWEQRQLCSDGACVGVIGGDGTCKVCGRAAPNWGDERKRGLLETSADEAAAEDGEDDEYEDDDEDYEDDDEESDEADEGDEDDGVIAAKSAPGGEDWSKRQLCPDGTCVGLLGADGKCNVCGRSAG